MKVCIINCHVYMRAGRLLFSYTELYVQSVLCGCVMGMFLATHMYIDLTIIIFSLYLPSGKGVLSFRQDFHPGSSLMVLALSIVIL